MRLLKESYKRGRFSYTYHINRSVEGQQVANIFYIKQIYIFLDVFWNLNKQQYYDLVRESPSKQVLLITTMK